ncbi:MAG: hypothetical protein LUG61_10330 [Lachnospiraceae bacterium]|nr:hypothetical protein [Lachnospiraceae bacterium]
MAGKNKNHEKRGIIIFISVLFVLPLAVLSGSLLYMTKYKVETIDMQQSPDGAYELKLQSVGEPYFPFGGAPGRLVLKENETVISRTRFEIANDGGPFTENAWKVTWLDDYVEIILSGQDSLTSCSGYIMTGRLKVRRLILIMAEIVNTGMAMKQEKTRAVRKMRKTTRKKNFFQGNGRLKMDI